MTTKLATNLKFKYVISLALLMVFIFTSCEKMVFDAGENEQNPPKEDVNVVFNIAEFEQVPFTQGVNMSRAGTPINQVCNRIDLAIFDDNGRVTKISQQSDNEEFGKIGVNLANGAYQVVIIAHNCTGAATISTPDKITFPNNKVTDTFYYYADISISGEAEYTIQMKRAVAKFRLITDKNVPANVATMKFYYLGGSSTFDATTGFGNVNSRQTELRNIDTTTNQYEIYTFPHANTGELKITVTAMDAAENTILERVFEEVPVERNMVTQYSGTFFSDDPTQSSSLILTTNDTWGQRDYIY